MTKLAYLLIFFNHF